MKRPWGSATRGNLRDVDILVLRALSAIIKNETYGLGGMPGKVREIHADIEAAIEEELRVRDHRRRHLSRHSARREPDAGQGG
jgi:hypothetical protein